MRDTFTSPAPRIPGDPPTTTKERFQRLVTEPPEWETVDEILRAYTDHLGDPCPPPLGDQ